jgi:single-strand DNA-binding protein
MSDLNLIICSGALRTDPELRYTGAGTALLSILLDTTRATPQGPATTSLRVVFWGDLAESLASSCTAGERLLVQGSLRNRKTEKDGKSEWRTEIHATTFQSLAR